MAKSTLPQPTVKEDGTKVYILTSAQVKTLLNAAPKGATYHVWLNTRLPIEGDDDHEFPGMALIKVSYDVAVKVANDLLRNLEARGARVKISISNDTFYAIG